jgi:hypothetical protein
LQTSLPAELRQILFDDSWQALCLKIRLAAALCLNDCFVIDPLLSKAQDFPLLAWQRYASTWQSYLQSDSCCCCCFIYTEHFDLAPGNYALETAVLDSEGKRISARKSIVVMPSPSTGFGISGPMKDTHHTTAESDPLVIESKVVSPTHAPVISKANTANLPFYLVIYTDKSVPAPPQLVMEFSRNGQVLGSGSAPLGPPDKDGRIQYIAMAPVAQLDPGNFTIHFIAKQGSETAVESASFTLQ